MTDQDNTQSRPFLGISFECCKVYSRIYLNKAGSAYVGWCPRCAKQVRVRVDPRGSDQRFFEAH